MMDDPRAPPLAGAGVGFHRSKLHIQDDQMASERRKELKRRRKRRKETIRDRIREARKTKKRKRA